MTGTCFAGSFADSGRSDAWRCMSGNKIYDPCFAGFEGARPVVACLSSPTTGVAVVLTPTGGVPVQEANRKNLLTSLPWSLELVNGASCGLLTGATAAFCGHARQLRMHGPRLRHRGGRPVPAAVAGVLPGSKRDDGIAAGRANGVVLA